MAPEAEAPPRVLVVDDEEATRELLAEHLAGAGCETELAADGLEAWERLTGKGPLFDVVLADWLMPRMDGLELLARLKASPALAFLPVVLQTARSDRADMLAGIAAGAYYYLTKPCDGEMLQLIVRAACRDSRQHASVRRTLHQGETALRSLRRATFAVRTLEEAEGVAAVLSTVCPDPPRAAVGLCELLFNAVEHGNLGITYEEKSGLLAAGTWDAEVARRLALPANRDKVATVDFARGEGELRFTIRDRGAGFDWERYLQFKPERLFDSHGRGIAMARAMSFERLEYTPPGNEVVAVVATPGP